MISQAERSRSQGPAPVPTCRFQLIPPHLLRDVGLPTLALWLVVLWQLLHMSAHGRLDAFVVHHGGWHFNWAVYATVCAGGLSLLWLWLLRGTKSFLTVAPAGLCFEQEGRLLWHLPWKEFATWDWEHDILGQPYSIAVHTSRWQTLHLRLGALYAGVRRAGRVYPNPDYRALLEALAHYVPTKGAGWSRTVPWAP